MESLNFNLYTLILIFATIQGFLLAFLLISAKKFQKKSNVALSLCLISTSLIILQNACELIGFTALFPAIDFMPMRLIFLQCAAIYFFVQFLIAPNYRFKKIDYLILTPVIVQIGIDMAWFLSYLMLNNEIDSYKETFLICRQIEEIFSMLFALFVFVIALKKINTYQEKLYANYTSIEHQDLSWLKYFMYSILALWLVWVIFFTGHVTNKLDVVMYPVWIGMAALIYWLGYFMYLRRDVFEIAVFKEQSQNETPKLSEKTDEHFRKLLQLMDSEKLYLNPDLNMSILADKMELSNGYLSQIINQKEGKNFFDFVNGYRVNEVKKYLSNPKYDHYSILGIGLEAGFKSKSTFNAVFKKITGLTPSAYKRSIKK